MTAPDPAKPAPLVDEELRTHLAELIGVPVEDVTDDANLIRLGLGSLQIMRLITKFRRSGVDLGFGDLAGTPTFAGWNGLVVKTLAAAAAEPAAG
ncbi:phosphopantetheine-binding protein [Kitasatospora sp. NPDC094011]|uniref:phosphopantetheine-binding protein n=1 Tax=Kitasatospora sp. NPDC094011 TaxID=3364090 RepID=UPI0037F786D1